MKINACKPSNGFTLVELMVVIAIMAILATIGVTSFAFVQERQNKEKARVQIALLSNAIEEYKRDMGEYPGTDDTAVDGNVSKELYMALFYEGYEFSEDPNRPDPGNLKATKIYLPELDPRTSKVGWVEPTKDPNPGDDLEILDPWGATYRYRKGTNAENPDFDLWSMGKDGESDTKDDIRNF